MDELVSKGFPANQYAADTFRIMIGSGDGWNISGLLRDGMEVSSQNYAAFHVCARHGVVDACKLLLDRGLDLDGYQSWVGRFSQTPAPDETLTLLRAHCDSILQQGGGQAPGGMSLA